MCGGWVAHVEQGRYGHRAKKATWLYAHGTNDLPSLDWSTIADGASEAMISWCGNHTKKRYSAIVGRAHREDPRGEYDMRPRLRSKEASATPIAFRDLLLSIARAV